MTAMGYIVHADGWPGGWCCLSEGNGYLANLKVGEANVTYWDCPIYTGIIWHDGIA